MLGSKHAVKKLCLEKETGLVEASEESVQECSTRCCQPVLGDELCQPESTGIELVSEENKGQGTVHHCQLSLSLLMKPVDTVL